MVKAKVLKQLRKRIERAERIENPLLLVIDESVDAGAGGGGGGGPAKQRLVLRERQQQPSQEEGDNDAAVIPTTTTTEAKKKSTMLAGSTSGETTNTSLTLEYVPSVDVSDATLESCLRLFESNLGELYRQSSWGLDLAAKADELRHKRARFLLLYAAAEDDTAEKKKELAAFVHFRFCYDDDEEPEFAVLYVYEIHVSAAYQRKGLGRQLMAALESIARSTQMDKVMLTVFKANAGAMRFYTASPSGDDGGGGGLGYDIDENSPSRHGEKNEDYEILGKAVSKIEG